MKKIMLVVAIIIIACIILVLAMFGRDIWLSMPWNKQKAADAAQEYLTEAYQQEMEHIKTEYPPLNVFGQGYTVYFAPVDNRDIVFEVVAYGSFEVVEIRPAPNEPGYHFLPDNYYSTYFRYNASKPLQEFASNIWDIDVKAIASVHNSTFLGGFKIPDVLNEQMSVEDMEKHLDYDVVVSVDRILHEVSKFEESQRIFEMLMLIKDSGNTPKAIRFWYKTGLKEVKPKGVDSSTWSEFYIEFKDWSNIMTVEQIMDEIDHQWKY